MIAVYVFSTGVDVPVGQNPQQCNMFEYLVLIWNLKINLAYLWSGVGNDLAGALTWLSIQCEVDRSCDDTKNASLGAAPFIVWRHEEYFSLCRTIDLCPCRDLVLLTAILYCVSVSCTLTTRPLQLTLLIAEPRGEKAGTTANHYRLRYILGYIYDVCIQFQCTKQPQHSARVDHT